MNTLTTTTKMVEFLLHNVNAKLAERALTISQYRDAQPGDNTPSRAAYNRARREHFRLAELSQSLQIQLCECRLEAAMGYTSHIMDTAIVSKMARVLEAAA